MVAGEPELIKRGPTAMSEVTNQGNVFAVAVVIANAVLWPALYGLIRGVLN